MQSSNPAAMPKRSRHARRVAAASAPGVMPKPAGRRPAREPAGQHPQSPPWASARNVNTTSDMSETPAARQAARQVLNPRRVRSSITTPRQPAMPWATSGERYGHAKTGDVRGLACSWACDPCASCRNLRLSDLRAVSGQRIRDPADSAPGSRNALETGHLRHPPADAILGRTSGQAITHMLSSELVRSVLDSAPDAMIIIDSAGTILFANRQVTALFGYGAEEIVGARRRGAAARAISRAAHGASRPVMPATCACGPWAWDWTCSAGARTAASFRSRSA